MTTPVDIIYKNYNSFNILNIEVNIIFEETYLGRNTIAEINNEFYYLGDEPPTILAAILGWQAINEKDLTDQELQQILIDNKL